MTSVAYQHAESVESLEQFVEENDLKGDASLYLSEWRFVNNVGEAQGT